MRNIVLALAFGSALAGCTTTPNTARSETCIGEIEETTGSRVESTPDCPPAK